ncbi:MAG: hypothetical protein U0271_27765 [Polyangiaceae bacterium]
MLTSLGDGPAATFSAIRAGIGGLALQKRLPLSGRDPDWDPPEPMRAARVPTIPLDVPGPERIRRLALAALNDALGRVAFGRADLAKTALLVGGPSLDSAVEAWQLHSFANDLVDRAGLGGLAIVEQRLCGHASAAMLFARAAELLAPRPAQPNATAGAIEQVIVVLADTYLSRDRVAALDAAGRLGSRRSPEGFAGGEAGVALVLRPGRRGETGFASVKGIGLGVEADTFFTDRAPSGRGLEAAIQTACSSWSPGRAIQWVLSDMNGEPYRAADWGVARARLGARVASDLTLIHPADLLGDLGSAMGGVLTAFAADSLATGTAESDHALVLSAADGAERAAVLLEGA